MSKIDFKKIVQNVLLEVTWLDQEKTNPQGTSTEQPVPKETTPAQTRGEYPDWFVNILKHHERLGLGHINNNEIRNLFNIAFKPYVSAEDAQKAGKGILILDTIKTIYDQVTPKPGKNINTFLSNNNVNQIGEQEAENILSYTNKNQWVTQNYQVANALKLAKSAPFGTIGKIAGALGALRTGMGPVG
jgi:hypothetical protein